MYINKLFVFLVFSVAIKGARYDFIFNYLCIKWFTSAFLIIELNLNVRSQVTIEKRR